MPMFCVYDQFFHKTGTVSILFVAMQWAKHVRQVTVKCYPLTGCQQRVSH